VGNADPGVPAAPPPRGRFLSQPVSSLPTPLLLPAGRSTVLSTPNYLADFDPIVSGLIRSKAARLIGRARLNEHDVEDLLQECRAKLVRELPSYDPTKGSLPGFVTTLVRRHLSNHLRHRFAAKRDPRKARPLSSPGGGHGPGPGLADHGPASREGWQDRVDLRLELERVLDGLEPELRALAERLKYQSVAEAARDSRVPRTTLQSRLHELRERFRKAGLQEFLSDPSSFRRPTG
jgi:RNA polymerase sigma factor (sigma-70 family)